ncbi:MAG: Hemolysin-type calcium-binding repeat-containing protein [Rhizobium sp.]|nr:Hemolysin-type calcium-binding repeat-containing protein [Rhizobium sp.]
MPVQFSADATEVLADAVLLNRAIYGGPDALSRKFLDDYKASRDPDAVGSRKDLFVYDRYDDYLKKFGFDTLSSSDLGFAAEDISASDTNAGLDRNYTYAGGLFRNNYRADTDTAFTAAGAVAMTSLKDNGDGKTLYLTFRGTDADGPLADGEAGTAAGQMRYYQQLKDLIDQVYDYISDPTHDVSKVVVSGHSLGGTVADLFALYDGARFDAIEGVDFQVIALASAGVAPDLLALMPGYDTDMVTVGSGGAITLHTPDWYFQYDQSEDIVRNPGQYDAARHASEDPFQAFITGIAVGLLQDHVHFEDNRLSFETPLIDQYEISKNLSTNFLVEHYADFYELIGSEFAKAWALAADMNFDAFIALFGVSDAVRNTPGHNNVNGWGVGDDSAVDYSARADDLFVLGFSGKDEIRTGIGADFIAGGQGKDRLFSGDGDDFLLGDIRGRKGDDVLKAGAGDDILAGGRGADRLSGQAGADTFVFAMRNGRDAIGDFSGQAGDGDTIDLSGLRGITDWADLVADHLVFARGKAFIEVGHNVIVLNHVLDGDLVEQDFLF